MTPPHPARHLLRAKDLVDARYREPLDVRTIAGAAKLSPAHFSRAFRRAFGVSPHQYLLQRRLERAAALLRSTDRSVADICLTVGLRSVGSFTSSFGRMFGMSPTAYRAAHPPAVLRARVPTCVLMAWARPDTARLEKTAAMDRASVASRYVDKGGHDVDQTDERAGLGSRPGRGARVLHREARNGAPR